MVGAGYERSAAATGGDFHLDGVLPLIDGEPIGRPVAVYDSESSSTASTP
jgi:hypothetical protein